MSRPTCGMVAAISGVFALERLVVFAIDEGQRADRVELWLRLVRLVRFARPREAASIAGHESYRFMHSPPKRTDERGPVRRSKSLDRLSRARLNTPSGGNRPVFPSEGGVTACLQGGAEWK